LLEIAISEALSLGSSSFEVDGCLKFAIIADEKVDYDQLFGSNSKTDRIIFNFINEIKNNMIWGCYFPYALTLSNTNHYEKFIRGEISIISLLNIDNFEKNLALKNSTLKVEFDKNHIQCQIILSNLENHPDTAFYIIAEHMFCRIWTDFLHPRWIINNAVDTIKNNIDLLSRSSDDSQNT